MDWAVAKKVLAGFAVSFILFVPVSMLPWEAREDLKLGPLRWDRMTPPEWQEKDWRAAEELRRLGACTPFEKEYIARTERGCRCS